MGWVGLAGESPFGAAHVTPWTWVWVNSGRWWWTGRPGVLWFMGSQRLGNDWATELNWGGHGQIVPDAGDAWGPSHLHIQDGVFPHVADPCPGVPGQLCASLARLSFYPQPLNVARWVSLQNGGLGVVKMIISWLASPRVSIRETMEGSITLLVTHVQKSYHHFYHIQTIIKRCVFI